MYMKKLSLILISFLIVFNVKASDKYVVTLNKCVDGDTAWFNLNGEKIKARFLAIDTPESTNKKEAYGKKASNYTCNSLKNASKIEIEYDDKSDKLDKYERHLVWVFTDDKLLQESLVKEGLAEIKYVYGDYKYLSILKKANTFAKENKLNIYSNEKYNDISYIYLYIIIIILLIIISPKKAKKIIKKIKNNI